MTLNLQSLDGLPPSAFKFAGTGGSTASDASAGAYVVNTGRSPRPGFVTALSADLNGTTAVIDLAASGQYDSAKNTFTATRIVVLLSN